MTQNQILILVMLMELQELAPMIIAGKTKYAVVPEPALSQVLSKNPDLKVVMELNEEWKNNNSSDYGFPKLL